MRKIISVTALLLFIMDSLSYGAVKMPNVKDPLKRSATVMGRGVVGLVTIPAELPATFKREAEVHKRLWPITAIPRWCYNFFVRVPSNVNDVAALSVVSLFSNDTSPWTEPMGLPEYPWQEE